MVSTCPLVSLYIEVSSASCLLNVTSSDLPMSILTTGTTGCTTGLAGLDILCVSPLVAAAASILFPLRQRLPCCIIDLSGLFTRQPLLRGTFSSVTVEKSSRAAPALPFAEDMLTSLAAGETEAEGTRSASRL